MAFRCKASLYDERFLKNGNVLYSEILLIKYFLDRYRVGRALSVGCGSALFESILRRSIAPKDPYPIELIKEAKRWPTAEDVKDLVGEVDFAEVGFA